MSARDVVAYRVGDEGDPKRMLLTFAAYYGISKDVERLLEDKGSKAPDLHVGGLANLLQVHRTVKGLTIQKVHERCGIARSQIGYYEGQKAKNPGIRTLQAVSYGYGLPFALVLVSALQDINPHIKSRL